MKTVTLFQFILLCLIYNSSVAQSDYILQQCDNGIEVYYKKNSNDIYEIKVKTKFNISSKVFLDKIQNIELYPNWIYRCKEAHRLSKTNNKYLLYSVTDIPWPISDRDIITCCGPPKKINDSCFVIVSHSVPDAIPIKRNCVRQEYTDIKWIITSISKKQIFVDYTIKLKINQKLPDSIMRMLTTRGPYETFQNLHELFD